MLTDLLCNLSLCPLDPILPQKKPGFKNNCKDVQYASALELEGTTSANSALQECFWVSTPIINMKIDP